MKLCPSGYKFLLLLRHFSLGQFTVHVERRFISLIRGMKMRRIMLSVVKHPDNNSIEHRNYRHVIISINYLIAYSL